MTASWQIVAVTLAAVLVGASVPVLVQLVLTLRSARRVLDDDGPRLRKTLDEVSEAVARLNGSARFVAALGAAVGPAVTAAVRALRRPEESDAAANGSSPSSSRRDSMAGDTP